MKKGRVKWYNETKGFGFIEPESGGDIFVHRSGLFRSFAELVPGQEVEFEITQGSKGPVATNVKPLK
ncbi:MAG: cold-shock protein [Bacteroidales bacterium]|nr:cold-shock protein [Bacteroidales bacterium]